MALALIMHEIFTFTLFGFAITYIHAHHNGDHLHNQQVSMLVPWWDKAFSNNLLAMWSLAIPCCLRYWSRRCMTLLAYQKQQGNRPHTQHHAFISFSHLPYLFGPFGQIYIDLQSFYGLLEGIITLSWIMSRARARYLPKGLKIKFVSYPKDKRLPLA